MNTKMKNIVISCSFVFFLVLFMFINIFAKDKAVSYEERRKLARFPQFKTEKLTNGEYFEEMEEYFLDQFYLRENFRKIKTFVNTKVFNEKDNNDIYIVDNAIYKMEYKLNEKSIYNSANLYNKIVQTYFKNSNVYYTIVPDKNYFVAKEHGYLHLDYDKLISIMKNNTNNMKYIDITKDLKISDYYRTDLHWKQENITQIGDKILQIMGLQSSKNKATNNNKINNDSKVNYNEQTNVDNKPNLAYNKKTFEPFYGSYYGQAASNIKPDKLTYLSDKIIQNCKVYNYEKQKYIKVYDDKDFDNIDSYDVFLGGAKSLLTIENPSNTSGKELYIFRDSFGSSLSPLLIKNYSKIHLIDLRYINSTQFEKHINIQKNSDVLFMYNTSILNNSSIITRFFR